MRGTLKDFHLMSSCPPYLPKLSTRLLCFAYWFSGKHLRKYYTYILFKSLWIFSTKKGNDAQMWDYRLRIMSKLKCDNISFSRKIMNLKITCCLLIFVAKLWTIIAQPFLLTFRTRWRFLEIFSQNFKLCNFIDIKVHLFNSFKTSSSAPLQFCNKAKIRIFSLFKLELDH